MSSSDNPTTIILLSGGMNCATILFDLVRLQNRPVVEAMIFNTDAPTNEYMAARAMAERAGVPISLWNHNVGPFMDMNLEYQPDESAEFGDGKLSLIMMLLNAAYRAKQHGVEKIVTGHLESELFGITADEFADTIAVVSEYAGIPEDAISAPLWHETKDGVFWLAKELGVLGEITAYTTSCLEGDEETTQGSWGYGCGECRKCVARAEAWALYLERLKK